MKGQCRIDDDGHLYIVTEGPLRGHLEGKYLVWLPFWGRHGLEMFYKKDFIEGHKLLPQTISVDAEPEERWKEIMEKLGEYDVYVPL